MHITLSLCLLACVHVCVCASQRLWHWNDLWGESERQTWDVAFFRWESGAMCKKKKRTRRISGVCQAAPLDKPILSVFSKVSLIPMEPWVWYINSSSFDAVAGDTLCILALMFVCAKPSMTSSKLVLFQMHEMTRKLQTVLGHFLPPSPTLAFSHLLPSRRLKSTQGLGS